MLVPPKRMTRLVSGAFRGPQGTLPAIAHSAAVDMESTLPLPESLKAGWPRCTPAMGVLGSESILVSCEHYHGAAEGRVEQGSRDSAVSFKIWELSYEILCTII
jgi:hypothetical protein